VRRPRFALSMWLWLVLMVIVVSGVAVEVEFGVTQRLINAGNQQAENTRVLAIQRILGSQPAHWSSLAWQRRARSALAAQGADVAVFQAGRAAPLFVTPLARRLLSTQATRPAAATVPYVPPSAALPIFQRIVIPAPTMGSPPVGVAYLWYTRLARGEPSVFWWFGAAYGTMAILVALVIWLLHRAVIRPLMAMNRAAEGIAGGDFDVRLPSSPVREIAEVSAALEGMSGALRESLSAQARLEEDRRLFVGAVAHDLRTPLFMLRGYLKGLQTGVASTPEKMTHYVEACLARADALERLIADLFAFTRLEYLEQEPKPAPMDLDALLRAAADGAAPLAAERRIAISLDGTDGSGMISADCHLLGRAVENLLDNALRHTPDGGEVRLRWSLHNDTASFSVKDSGPGIAADDLPHIFTPLYRAESSRNRQTGGAGLGLTIARRILQSHGGDLVAGNAAGGGAVFTATLPAHSHEFSRQEAALRGG
jgi:signal transduction histidine kinase